MNKKGFTIAELLVTIGIIGILSSVVYINLGGAIDSANNAKFDNALSVLVKEMLLKQASQGGSARGLCNATYNINGKTYTTTTNNSIVSSSIEKYLVDNVSFIKNIVDNSETYGSVFPTNLPVDNYVDYYCFDGDEIKGRKDFLLFIGIYNIHRAPRTSSWRRPFRCLDGSVVIDSTKHPFDFRFNSNGPSGHQTVNIGTSGNQYPQLQDRSCEDARKSG